jgi:ATP-binding cassette subfamily B protein|mmetsp:Transcript_7255/g.921  ORF Transcript_7255/g.921 Transcript_7255/m.921 type:complete len:90 (+) Transcript_7255:179-448(+)
MTYLGAVYDWYLPFILLGSICAYILFTYFTTEWRTKIRRRMNEKDNMFNTKATDALINIETVKYFNAEEHEKIRYSEAFDEYKRENILI